MMPWQMPSALQLLNIQVKKMLYQKGGFRAVFFFAKINIIDKNSVKKIK